MRLDFPATARNGAAILAELRGRLGDRGKLLEVASGSGQHAALLAPELPGWTWQPSDLEPEHLASIAAWTGGCANVLPPLALDVLGTWPEGPYDAVLAINLIHIAPWQATGALMRGAASVLRAGGLLYLYGAFHLEGRPTSESNAAFDEGLRRQNPAWGVRHFEEVCAEASAAGLGPVARVAMPANNFSVWFGKGSS